MKKKTFFKFFTFASATALGIITCMNNLNVEAKGLGNESHEVIKSSDTTWINIGESLPCPVDYSDDDGSGNTTLLDIVRKGDLFYTPAGSSYVFGNTGHIAIIEGVFYDEVYQQRYIRMIEANGEVGVRRGVLTKDRFKAIGDGGQILRVKNVTDDEIDKAVEFSKNQLGKGYWLWPFDMPSYDGSKDKWYCSELTCAAYYNATNGRIDLDCEKNFFSPAVAPIDITRSPHVEKIEAVGYAQRDKNLHIKLINGVGFNEFCSFDDHDFCIKCHNHRKYYPAC